MTERLYYSDAYLRTFEAHVVDRLDVNGRPAVSVNGMGHHVAHNLIHDGPHNAILLNGNDHLIELNEIHSVCFESNDAGAIYSEQGRLDESRAAFEAAIAARPDFVISVGDLIQGGDDTAAEGQWKKAMETLAPYRRIQHLIGSTQSGISDLGASHREHLARRIRRGG